MDLKIILTTIFIVLTILFFLNGNVKVNDKEAKGLARLGGSMFGAITIVAIIFLLMLPIFGILYLLGI